MNYFLITLPLLFNIQRGHQICQYNVDINLMSVYIKLLHTGAMYSQI